MQPVLADVLAKRRDRAIAIILRVKEAECDSHLSREASARLRKVVLDQLNEFCDLALDLLRASSSPDVTVNEIYVEKIDALYEHFLGSK